MSEGGAHAPAGHRGKSEKDRQRMRRDAARYLRIRERSAQEVRVYLDRRGHPPETVARLLDELRETRLVDDRRFAGLYLSDRRRLRPASRLAVLRDLQHRGVARETAEAALAACDPPWEDAVLAREALARRWARWPEADRRRRAVGFLQRRGFGGAAIHAALDRRVDGGVEGEWPVEAPGMDDEDSHA